MTATDKRQPETILPFTGERFTPECVREIWYEHWHRYVFAIPLVRGKRVLDAACGEGYGSGLLASVAASVVGIDIDEDSIKHARSRYGGRENLTFTRSSVVDIPLADATFDIIVSFETIEHLSEHAGMLEEFQRLLAPGGVLLLSSPDRDNYNVGNEPNPFHVRELNREELISLLAPRFPAIRLHGQRLSFHSLIWHLGADEGAARIDTLDTVTDRLRTGVPDSPVYYIAVCAHAERDLPEMPALSLFSDEQASVYSHYNAEIARLIRADHRIIALEKEISDLRERLVGIADHPGQQ